MRYGMYVDTKLGRWYLVEQDGGLARVDADSADVADVLQSTPLLEKAAEQLKEYCAGVRQEFDLPVHMEGSDFQRKVWAALAQIPYGETRTYGEIAKAVGCPGGARAVGGACNRNPVMIVIPCHRVIGGNGRLVGFGGGLPLKKALLAVEGIYQEAELEEAGLEEAGLEKTGLEETGLEETGLEETEMKETELKEAVRVSGR